MDGLELGAFYQPYEEDGRRNAPYEPRMMVKVLIYTYATGVFSSRKIARKLEEDVAFRMLAAGNFPQHRTICEFRRRHLKDFKKLFVQVVSLGREMGMVRLGRLGIDGTKVRANASRRQGHELRAHAGAGAATEGRDRTVVGESAAAGWGGRRALRGRPARGRVAGGVASAGGPAGSDRGGQQRLEAAQRAVDDRRGRKPGQDSHPKGGQPYKRDYGEPEEKAQSNFTDPESRIMKTAPRVSAMLQRPVGG